MISQSSICLINSLMDTSVATDSGSFGPDICSPSEDLKPLMGCSELSSPLIVTKQADVSPTEEPLEWLISDVRSVAGSQLAIISGECLGPGSFLPKVKQDIEESNVLPNAQDIRSVVTDIGIKKEQVVETSCALGDLERHLQKEKDGWNYKQDQRPIKHKRGKGCLHVEAELSSDISKQKLEPRRSNRLLCKAKQLCHTPSLSPVLLFNGETCDRVMKNLSSFRKHQRIHTGEHPFKCKVTINSLMDTTVATDTRSFGPDICSPSEDLKPLMGCSELSSPLIVTKQAGVSPTEEPLEWLISDVRSVAGSQLAIISGECLESESFLPKVEQDIEESNVLPNAQDIRSVVTDIDVKKEQVAETPCALGDLERHRQKENDGWNYKQDQKPIKHEREEGCLRVKAELNSSEIFKQKLEPEKGNLLSKQSCHPTSLAPMLLFKCETCDKVMKTLASFREHQRIHSGERPFKCKVCKKNFIRCADLIKHHLVHSNSRPHKCKVCGKKFKLAGDLRKHSNVHSDKFPFKCESCEKKFKRAACLTKHMRVHTEEKPFPCPVCGKRFKWEASLKEHHRIHSGEKPFQCPDCKKRFTHLSTFLQHKRIHGERAAFTCNVCDKSFNHKSNLRKHQRALHT